ncbi:hypothetical protein MtrunA17_Chr7g0268271 [Medicago truncatula]|uniref:Uncharacterized protein n=1 Tax=Medicago truncatula TaxID=3880 RepID=A0A396H6G1_MEDTR|nr:hypothetical protein MtrunA17_Chr7g0268271 [Medicago truncatula]
MVTDVFEFFLEIVPYMTFFSPTISLDMWNLWPLMMETLSDWAIDFISTYLLRLTKVHYFSTSFYMLIT